MTCRAVQKALRAKARSEKAVLLKSFFKTGPGQYGEGDLFIGVTMPEIRKIVRLHSGLSFSEIRKLLKSPVHEERLTALLMLVQRYQLAATEAEKRLLFNFYTAHLRWINNWDLVDSSAHHIVGAHLEKKERALLRRLARSGNLWERRVAIVATWHYIRKGDARETYRLALLLLNDPHDLLHKAVGWMLRETGKHCSAHALEAFLESHATRMPRTMLRYAIERFPERKKRFYLTRGK